MLIQTRLGEMDDSRLQRRDVAWEDDNIRIESVEYCLSDCEGQAHVTNIAQGDGCFCEKHVHRSVNGTIKRWPVEMGGIAAALA